MNKKEEALHRGKQTLNKLLGQFEDSPVETALRRWATTGIIFAVLLTGFMGALSWQSARRAARDADWVTHTHAVQTTLQAAIGHAVDVETGSRGFAVTGEESFLQPYWDGQRALTQDLETLRYLTADNATQQRRLDTLDSQMIVRMESARRIVDEKRNTGAAPSTSEFLEGKRWMDAMRATVAEMQSEEAKLLVQREERAQAARRLTQIVTLSGALAGVTFLVFAGFTIRREINHGVQIRGQLRVLNANLEQLVEQRTAALAGQAEELSRQADELIHSQQALQTQTILLQSVLDSTAEGLIATDENGKFILWNPAAQTILDRGAEDFPPERWAELYRIYRPDTLTPLHTDELPLVRAMRGEACVVDMFARRVGRADGVWIEGRGNPIRDKDGRVRGGVVAMRDVTQKRADDLEIRKLNDELEQRVVERTEQLQSANKELEAFTYSVSHDLRAPLRHISGFSKLLTEEYGSTLPPDAQHHLQRIQEGTRRMGMLVDDLLNLARLGRRELSLQVSGLKSVVDEVIAELAYECEGRQIDWKIGALPFTECDPGLMKQVFQNLISNALKFTRPRSPAVIEVGQQNENGDSVLFVRDNGVGFNMKYADKLFGVFQRLHRAEDFEGTGVGLATVQRIVQKHGGRIWVEAELDKGATLYFTLGASESAEFKSKAATAGGNDESTRA